MTIAYVFPGQGSQFSGMGMRLYQQSTLAKEMFEEANKIVGFRITDLMFAGKDEDLRKTGVAQLAVFLDSVIPLAVLGDSFAPDMVAGHSLGEYSALVAAKVLSFEDALRLVMVRGTVMQEACEKVPSTMVAVIGLDADVVEKELSLIENEVVVLANYNSPQQIVISGSLEGIKIASQRLKEAGAKRIIDTLKVSGGFHSPLMKSVRVELAKAINATAFNQAICPIYQNVTANPTTNPIVIRNNLIEQPDHAVLWYQSILNMIADGAQSFTEVGPGDVLQNLIRRIAPKNIEVSGMSFVKQKTEP